MRIDEIIPLADRDENVQEFIKYFDDTTIVVASLGEFHLKKHVDKFNDIRYGLFNDNNDNELMAYMWLSDETDYYQVRMVAVGFKHQGSGYATYMMDYAVLNDKLTLASDSHQTKKARELWMALVRNHRFKIFYYDTRTGEKTIVKSIKNNEDSKIWGDDKEHILLVTEEHDDDYKTKMYERLQLRTRGGLKNEWHSFYGPGTSSPNHWNP